MTRKSEVYPLNRVEGDLEIAVELEDNRAQLKSLQAQQRFQRSELAEAADRLLNRFAVANKHTNHYFP